MASAQAQVQAELPPGVTSISDLVTIIAGRDASRYTTGILSLSEVVYSCKYLTILSAAALVVLLYDHLLLLSDEIELIWPAKATWSKHLFLLSRYSVPIFIMLGAHETSTISNVGLSRTCNHSASCWIACIVLGSLLSLMACNVFAMQRIDALWGRNRKIRWIMISSFFSIYGTTVILAIYRTVNSIFHTQLGTCLLTARVKLTAYGFGLPVRFFINFMEFDTKACGQLLFDVLLFGLICWNVLDRPRHLHTTVIKQIYLDGALYFVVTLCKSQSVYLI
ncbi:hypothetical protein M422DRAFT_45214 [Sphaerobolus stellatus SS14]|nr:hypothetical protein M422DRAFT_45214 [Sphaerobolus stellatus SS14]